MKVFRNKKEQTSEFFFQICSHISWKWKNARSNPLLRLKWQKVIYGFSIKNSGVRVEKTRKCVVLSSVIYFVQQRCQYVTKLITLISTVFIHCLYIQINACFENLRASVSLSWNYLISIRFDSRCCFSFFGSVSVRMPFVYAASIAFSSMLEISKLLQ